MASGMRAVTSEPRPKRNSVSFKSGLRLQITALLRERDALMGEIQQLRAAVQIYSDVLTRLQNEGPRLVSRR